MKKRATSIAALVVLAGMESLAQGPVQTPAARVRQVMADARFASAMNTIDRNHDQLIADIVSLTEIPAPPFKEDRKGAAFMQMLREAGLSDVERDPEGNVMGVRRGTGGGPLIAIAAHLDTVFPEGTDVRVKRDGTRLSAPGIGDNTRSVAVLLAMIRAMDAGGIRTTADILFVGDVGEEGLGDLRGVKYLFTKGRYKDRISQFIALDGSGPGDNIVTGAVGSKRYLVTFKGPGGHSYGAFGLVNPAFAMAAAIQQFQAIKVPPSPKTTFNVGRVGGGTSVNSIPQDVWMEVDMRSESPLELEKVETAFLAMVRSAVDGENRARSTTEGKVAADVKLIGARPSGRTASTAPIVQIASEAAMAAGLTPTFNYSSTDANLPISLGIPAIRLESGGTSDRAHAPDEWIDVEKTVSLRGIRVVLATLLALAGLAQ
ncbi:MAG TPA: M20/M25/M40 family metallo-hydrolase [Vicinamibacterales bacterium]|nr:M20/M25/M40 family metallo-hydrolase [Vicinamibacterales bacterium]